MSLASTLVKPSPPYRYLYIVGSAVFSLELLLLVSSALPPFEPVTFVAGSTFGVALLSSLLMSYQPIEAVFDWLIRRRDKTAPDQTRWPPRHRVARYRLMQGDREALLNSINEALGTSLLLPGLFLTSLVWPHPFLGWLPWYASVGALLFLVVALRRRRRFRRRLTLAYKLILRL